MKLDDSLISALQDRKLKYSITLDGKSYPLSDVFVSKSFTPMTKPSTRGGAYFAGTSSFRIKGTIHDTSIIPFLSKTMLGPNTEFENLEVTVTSDYDTPKFILVTNLTNTMQSSSKLELNLIIIDVKN